MQIKQVPFSELAKKRTSWQIYLKDAKNRYLINKNTLEQVPVANLTIKDLYKEHDTFIKGIMFLGGV